MPRRLLPLLLLFLAPAWAPLLTAVPALAQWSRVDALPAADVYSLTAQGDTLLAGVDQAVWISTDGGTTWRRSADVPAPPVTVEAVRIVRGRLYAGTYGQGVYMSPDLGFTWEALNTGLTGGLFNSHYQIVDFDVRGDSLLAGTDGAGVYALPLGAPTAWQSFGTELTGSAAGSVRDLGVHGDRILASAGINGLMFHNDRGQPDWSWSYLDNSGIVPGHGTFTVLWTGSAWLVATDMGVYRSATGVQPWTPVGPYTNSIIDALLATREGRTYAAFNVSVGTRFVRTGNDGTDWEVLETVPTYTYELAVRGNDLYAARIDGLWLRDVTPVGVPGGPGAPGAVLALARVGAHPARGEARLRYALPSGGQARLVVHDVRGREVARLADGAHAPGEHEVTWRCAGAAPGVYFARLESSGHAAAERIVVVAD